MPSVRSLSVHELAPAERVFDLAILDAAYHLVEFQALRPALVFGPEIVRLHFRGFEGRPVIYLVYRGNDYGRTAFSDFFESLFGSRRGSARGHARGFKGQDYNAELHLSLRDAAETHKQILEVNGKKIRITVPAGIADGQTIRLAGQGGEGINGGPAGDLYITFVIGDDPVYKREGDNLYTTVPVDLYTAILGGEITVDTLNGKVKLHLKPETQNGTRVRLKGKGFPVYKEEGKFGDLLITYEVKLPTHLTEKQKQLFRELQNS